MEDPPPKPDDNGHYATGDFELRTAQTAPTGLSLEPKFTKTAQNNQSSGPMNRQGRPLSKTPTQNSFDSIVDIEITDYMDPTMTDDDVFYGQVYGRQGEMNFF